MSPLKFIGGFVGWRYVPDFAAGHLVVQFHRFYGSVLGRQPPAPGTALYAKHRRYMYALVVFGYAMYTFHGAATSIGPNFYEMLGISPGADEAALKAGFRAFAKKYHPDRAGPQFEPLFMEVRDAYEALKDPVTRFAYDRFGPQALQWKNCQTMQEYLSHGMSQSVAYYVISFCVLIFWNRISPRDLAFWNFILLFWTFAQELYFLLGPSISEPSSVAFSSWLFTDPASPSRVGLLAFLWPYRVAYQHITFLKSLSLLISSAIYQVIPQLFPTSTEKIDQVHLAKFFSLLNSAARDMDQKTYEIIQTELHACHGEATGVPPSDVSFANISPCVPAAPVMELVTSELENVLLENALLSGQNEQLRKATEQAVRVRSRLEDVQPPAAMKEAYRPKGPTRRTPPRPLDVSSSPSRPTCVRGRSMSWA